MKNKACSVPILFFLLIAFAFPSEKSEFSLSQLISLGLKNNPVLLAKFQEAEAKKAAFKASKLLANPELEFHKGEGKFYDGTLQRNTDGVSLSQYLENPMKRHYRHFKLSGFITNELDGKNKKIGVSLDIPLWNFKSREIAEAESLFLKQNEELKALKMEIIAEIKSKLSEQRLSEQTINLFQKGLLKQAEESLKISEMSYKQGEISLIDYLDSQRTYYSILKDYQESLYSWNIDRSALEKAAGRSGP